MARDRSVMQLCRRCIYYSREKRREVEEPNLGRAITVACEIGQVPVYLGPWEWECKLFELKEGVDFGSGWIR
jgi:hypothetical protein